MGKVESGGRGRKRGLARNLGEAGGLPFLTEDACQPYAKGQLGGALVHVPYGGCDRKRGGEFMRAYPPPY